jgi:acetyl esterase
VVDRVRNRLHAELGQSASDLELGDMVFDQASTVAARQLLAGNGPGPDMYDVRDLVDPTDKARRARLLVPVPQPRATVVYFHSGGWLSDSIEDAEPIARRLAERTACSFALVDYRPRDARGATVAGADAVYWWNRLTDDEEVHGASSRPALVMGLGYGARLCREVIGSADANPLLRRPLLHILIDPSLRNCVPVEQDAEGTAADVHIRQILQAANARYGLDEVDFYRVTVPALVVTADSFGRPDAEGYVNLIRSRGVAAELRVHKGQMHGFFEAVEIRQGERAPQQVVRVLRAVCSRSERLRIAAVSNLDDLLAHA